MNSPSNTPAAHAADGNVPAPRAYLWALRATVVVLAVVMGKAISVAADGRTSTAGLVATIAWGAVVAALVIDLILSGAVGLTVVRLLVPATVPAAVVALASGAGAAWGTAALAAALLATAVALAAETGEALVQGSAYGHEQRFPLRLPATLLPPVVLSWLVWCAAAIASVVLLAARQWVGGALLAVLAAALTYALVRRYYRYARRWLVVVPAGVVVHDHVVLAETLMVQKPNVTVCRLAMADTQAADLTGPAAGHAVEVAVKEMVLGVFSATPRDPKGNAIHMQSFLIAPSRPGRALRALAAAKLPVG